MAKSLKSRVESVGTPEDLARIVAESTYEAFLEKEFRVRTKAGKVVDVKLWEAQRRYCQLRAKVHAEHGQSRICSLKSRQVGRSTVVGGCICKDALAWPGTRVGVIADRAGVAMYLAKTYLYEPLTDICGKYGIPITKFGNNPAMFPVFTLWPDDRERQTEFWVGTANSDDKTFRSMTFQIIWASEVARWQRGTKGEDGQGERVFLAMMNSVPDPSEASQVAVDVESTAAGAAGIFHETWQDARGYRKGWVPSFEPWFTHEQHYYGKGANGERRDAEEYKWWDGKLDELRSAGTLSDYDAGLLNLDKHEMAMAKAYPNLMWGNILWRRKVGIPIKCKGSLASFRQEYPSSPEEAFLASGEPVFDTALIDECRHAIETQPPIPMALTIIGERKITLEKYEGYDPELRLFREVDLNKEHFAIGADVALGAGNYSLTNAGNTDLSVASIWSVEQRDQVAEWVGKPLPEDFGDIVFYLGVYFHTAAINVEVNREGRSVLARLLKWRYPKIYMFCPEDTAYATRPILGTPVDSSTRSVILNSFRHAFMHRQLKVRSPELLNEMCGMQAVGGRWDHIRSRHDDRVFAAAHANWLLADHNPLFAAEEDMTWQDDSSMAGELAHMGMASTAFDPRSALSGLGRQRGNRHPSMNPWG